MSFRKSVKKVARKAIKVHEKYVGKWLRPVAVGVATAINPALGVGVLGVTTAASKYTGATAARADGLSGRDARKKGRQTMQRTLKYGAIVGGSVFAAGVASAALTGSSVLTPLVSTAPKLLGFGGGTPSRGPGTGISPEEMASTYANSYIQDPGEIDPRTGQLASMTPTYSEQSGDLQASLNRALSSGNTDAYKGGGPSTLEQAMAWQKVLESPAKTAGRAYRASKKKGEAGASGDYGTGGMSGAGGLFDASTPEGRRSGMLLIGALAVGALVLLR